MSEIVPFLSASLDGDRCILLIHPLVLGSGRRLFGEGLPVAPLRLVDSRPSNTGVIIATYEPVAPAVEA